MALVAVPPLATVAVQVEMVAAPAATPVVNPVTRTVDLATRVGRETLVHIVDGQPCKQG